jgi:hypothetical protein
MHDHSQFWLSSLDPLLQKTTKLFGFPILRLWAYLMRAIPETCRAHSIKYLHFYYDYHTSLLSVLIWVCKLFSKVAFIFPCLDQCLQAFCKYLLLKTIWKYIHFICIWFNLHFTWKLHVKYKIQLHIDCWFSRI